MIILVNFEILGEMAIGGANDSPVQTAPQQSAQQQYQSKPVQNNENVEPNKPQAKSFYNNANKESQPAQKATPLVASNQATSNQMFNNLKIFGISSLNPYQNK